MEKNIFLRFYSGLSNQTVNEKAFTERMRAYDKKLIYENQQDDLFDEIISIAKEINEKNKRGKKVNPERLSDAIVWGNNCACLRFYDCEFLKF